MTGAASPRSHWQPGDPTPTAADLARESAAFNERVRPRQLDVETIVDIFENRTVLFSTGEAPPQRKVDVIALAKLPRTDLGNAERFRLRYDGLFLHVPEIGWLRWDGMRWASDQALGAVKRAAHETARAIQAEAEAIRGTEHDEVVKKGDPPVMLSEKLAAWGRQSESLPKLNAIVELAESYFERRADELDADPMKINVRNGTLHISRNADDDPISLHPHDPGDLITKVAGFDYDPKATCPRFDRFLAEIQPHAEVRRFLMQWFGYSLTGDTGEQKLVFLHGDGRNGKSTLVDAVGNVAGDYGDTIGIESFLDQGRARSAGAPTPDLARLPGTRFLRTSEPEKGAKLAEALIKLVTGGEPIQARFLNREFFKFTPAFKLTISGNHKPRVDGVDEGIWRRLLLVPFDIKVSAVNRSLPRDLKAEGAGVLNRLLDGLRDYLDCGGLVVPDAIADATSTYREDSDPLGRFLAAATVPLAGARTPSSRLYSVFSALAVASDETVWSQRGLAKAMKARGFRSIQNNVMWWCDIELTKAEYDFGDPPPRDYTEPHRDD